MHGALGLAVAWREREFDRPQRRPGADLGPPEFDSSGPKSAFSGNPPQHSCGFQPDFSESLVVARL